MRGPNKDRRRLFKRIEDAGYEVRANNGHFSVHRSDGQFVIGLSGTPSRRTQLNELARLRRVGVLP